VDFEQQKSVFAPIDKTDLESCLKREIDALSILRHPNIIRLEEWHELGKGQVCLVLELIVGGDLWEEIVSHRKGMREEVAEMYFSQLCSAVSYCHSQRVLYFSLSLGQFCSI
jgi:serine/threonine protein kinase